MIDTQRQTAGAKRPSLLLGVLLLALAYYASGCFALLLAIPPSSATPLWPPAGLALAALLLWGGRYWPGIAIGAAMINLHVGFDPEAPAASLALATTLAAGPTLQALISAAAIRRLGLYPSTLDDAREVMHLLFVGAALGCMTSAAYSTAVLCAAGVTPWSAFASHAFIWWVGDAIGVVAFTPALLLIGRNGPSRTRKLTVGVGLLAIFSLSVALFFQAQRFEDRKRQFELDDLNSALAADLMRQFEAYENILQGLDSFLSTATAIDAQRFDAYGAPFLREHREILALSWSKRVRLAEREAYETQLRAEGFENFVIWDGAPDGSRRPSPQRPEYFPVTYFSPNRPPPNARGLDSYAGDSITGATRRETLERALQTGWTRATERVAFVSRPGEYGLLLYHPVYRGGIAPATIEARKEALTGYVAGVFSLPGMIDSIRDSAEKLGVDLIIRDLDAPPDDQVLYSNLPADQDEARRGSDLSARSGVIVVAGRNWQLEIFERANAAFGGASWNLWFALFGGALFTGLSGAFLLIVTARADVVQRLVDERTAALREREARLDAIISNSADGILTIDDRNEVETFNPACERIFGYAADEVLGQRLERLMSCGGADCVGEELQCCLSAAKANAGGEGFKGWRKDAGAFDIEVSAGGFDLDGRRHVTLIIRDVTERRRSDAEREALLENLQKSNEELERFAYVASHDLQEPLRKIAVFSDMLRSRASDTLDVQSQRQLSKIHAAALRMKALIHDLLAYSRTSSQKIVFEPVRVAELTEEAVEMLGSAVEETGARIEVDGVASVTADSFLIRQLLQNLISNSIKYRGEAAPEIVVAAHETADTYEISVRDNGVGFDPAYAHKIFAVFERLHRKEEIEGTGVGLAVCERIARRHGGRIWAESAPGAGATFTLSWPKPAPEAARRPEAKELVLES